MNKRWAWFLKIFYGAFFVSPVVFLFLQKNGAEPLNPDLFRLASFNTFYLAVGTLMMTSILGLCFALMNTFVDYPGRRLAHVLLLVPMALPAYVLAFIYLGQFSAKADWRSALPEIQGELWFLVLVLSLCLTPYMYFFSYMGLRLVSQNEWETEKVLGAGFFKFFKKVVFPKVFPFFVSGQVLVLYESLSEFGAASIVNVPVMTTMIYKLWFDLFSFSGAVSLAAKYSALILIILIVESVLRLRGTSHEALNSHPLRGERVFTRFSFVLLFILVAYLVVSVLLPLLQILYWSFADISLSHLANVTAAFAKTLGLGLAVALVCLFFALSLQLLLKKLKESSRDWSLLSTLGYSIPGSILAVSAHVLMVGLGLPQSFSVVLLMLLFALSFKFFTIVQRSIGDRFDCLNVEHFEVTQVLGVGGIRRWRYFLWPELRQTSLVAALLVMIEVMKEMPMTLMLAPGSFQTLSIKIFNFTSEGEWEKAALPSLLLFALGISSVFLLNQEKFRRSQ